MARAGTARSTDSGFRRRRSSVCKNLRHVPPAPPQRVTPGAALECLVLYNGRPCGVAASEVPSRPSTTPRSLCGPLGFQTTTFLATGADAAPRLPPTPKVPCAPPPPTISVLEAVPPAGPAPGPPPRRGMLLHRARSDDPDSRPGRLEPGPPPSSRRARALRLPSEAVGSKLAPPKAQPPSAGSTQRKADQEEEPEPARVVRRKLLCKKQSSLSSSVAPPVRGLEKHEVRVSAPHRLRRSRSEAPESAPVSSLLGNRGTISSEAAGQSARTHDDESGPVKRVVTLRGLTLATLKHDEQVVQEHSGAVGRVQGQHGWDVVVAVDEGKFTADLTDVVSIGGVRVGAPLAVMVGGSTPTVSHTVKRASYSRPLLFSEDLAAGKSAEELQIEAWAKQFGLVVLEVERLFKLFREADEDNNGTIDIAEFHQLLQRFLGRKMASDIPEARIRRFWQGIDQDKNGSIDFLEFMTWWHSCAAHDILPQAVIKKYNYAR